MNTPRRPILPTVPQGADPAVRAYLTELSRAITTLAGQIHDDLSTGAATLTTFSSAPAVSDVAEGGMVLRIDAGNEALVANVDGAIKSVSLS